MALKIYSQDDKLVIHKRTDPTPAIAAARVARDIQSAAGQAANPMSDSWHIGRIDAHVLEQWVKEAGLKFSDREAVKELIVRKMNDGDFAAFRVKEGKV